MLKTINDYIARLQEKCEYAKCLIHSGITMMMDRIMYLISEGRFKNDGKFDVEFLSDLVKVKETKNNVFDLMNEYGTVLGPLK